MRKTMKTIGTIALGALFLITSCAKFDDGGRVNAAEKNLAGKDGTKTWGIAKFDRLYPWDDILEIAAFADYREAIGDPAADGANFIYVPGYDIIISDNSEITFTRDRKTYKDLEKKNGILEARLTQMVSFDNIYALQDPTIAFHAIDNIYVKKSMKGYWFFSDDEVLEIRLQSFGGEEEWIIIGGGEAEFVGKIRKLEKDALALDFSLPYTDTRTGRIAFQTINVSFDKLCCE